MTANRAFVDHVCGETRVDQSSNNPHHHTERSNSQLNDVSQAVSGPSMIGSRNPEACGKKKSPKHLQKEMKGRTIWGEVDPYRHPWSTAKRPQHTIFSLLNIFTGTLPSFWHPLVYIGSLIGDPVHEPLKVVDSSSKAVYLRYQEE